MPPSMPPNMLKVVCCGRRAENALKQSMPPNMPPNILKVVCCGRRAENALKRWQPKAGDRVKVLPYHKAVSSEQQRSNLLVRPALL